MFIILIFALRYPLRGTRPDIITVLPLSSLTDFDRIIISAVIFSGSVFLLISLVPQGMIIFSDFFYMVGLACQCMWLVFSALKDFTTTFWLSFESFHRLKSLTTESLKITVKLPYFCTCCCVFYGNGLLDLLIFSLSHNYFFNLIWFFELRASLVLHNPRYYSPFQYHHYLIIIGID